MHPRTWLTAALAVFSVSLGIYASDSAYVISTVAGSDWVGDTGPASQAILLQTEGIALDSGGNLYISEAQGHRVRRVSPDGVIRTVAGTGHKGYSGDGGPADRAQLNAPYGIAVDGSGALYIADLGNAAVRRVTPDGIMTTLVREPLLAPRNVAVDASGGVYIADFDGHRVYRFGGGRLTVVAGTGTAGFAGEAGPADLAQVGSPAGLAVDRRDGALYIGDTGNRAVRRVSGGRISSIARVAAPTGMTIDANGTLHVADPVSGVVYRIAASGTTALHVSARDIAVAPDGSTYAAGGGLVRKILPSGVTSTFAGGGNTAHGDQGKATSARLDRPTGVAVDRAGNLYIADRDNHRIRRISPEGLITTAAGAGEPGDSGDGGPATLARLKSPSSVSVDATGNLYVADAGNKRVRRVTPQGQILPVATTDAPAFALAEPSGAVLIADETGKLLRVANGNVTVLAADLKSPRGLALDASGNIYIAETGAARVRRLSPSLQGTDIAEGAWRVPRGVAVDDQGAVFVADTGRQQVVRVDAGGRALPIAGIGAEGFSGDGDAATLAKLGAPWDVAVGPSGALYVAEWENNRIRKLTPTEIAGTAPVLLADAVNAASGVAGPLAPGMLVALHNTGIQPGDIPETQFLFAGLAAEFVSIDARRILVVVPHALPVSGSFTIDVRHRGLRRVAIPAIAAEAAPALFPAVSNQNGSLNSAGNPAPLGSVVAFYGTGFGRPGLEVTAQIGGTPTEVSYAGPSGYPGIVQVNVAVPEGLSSGAQPVSITAAGASAQAIVHVQ